jgi:hypothetical protein
LKLQYDEQLSNFAFKFNFRRYTKEGYYIGREVAAGDPEHGRGLHSFTFQLNVSASYGIGGAFRGYFGGVYEVSGGVRGCLGCAFVSETAQVELRSGRV